MRDMSKLRDMAGGVGIQMEWWIWMGVWLANMAYSFKLMGACTKQGLFLKLESGTITVTNHGNE